ncbi:Ger(x)C family spore germination protein [Sporosarcina sp. GW1-11]|uniref:Ger(x)C family spore germination protein n=1 Tax=Sporosarcina sp. GW1-11 TaxID=2899126 RepID=UPI00294D1139|nr:Ger(x)C family spore germination protein [Sporosarcina sp. GW1-11]MDV6378338.1 Ger(x)C family spore germination protein [Sporosarcina sp. GW1-11]
MRNATIVVKVLIIALLLGVVLLQTGCAFKDIDKRIFVVAVGIDPSDKFDEGFKVTLKIALPFGSIKTSAKPSYAYISEEGASVGEAIRLLETHVDKVLELGHMKTIVIHEELLAEHLQEFMDYFVRRADIQLIAYVAAARPSAETILKVEPSTEAPASVALFNLFGDSAIESPFIVTTYLFQLRRDHLAKGINSVLPLIETNENKDLLIVNNSVVISRKKAPVILSIVETKYYDSLLKGSTGFTYQVENDQLKVLLDISKSKMSYKIIKSKNQTPKTIEIHIKMKGIIGESNKKLYLSKLDEYNDMASKEVQKKAYEFFKRMQEESVDPFGFGLRYRSTQLHRSDVEKVWANAYPTVEFKVTADVNLQSTGTTE